MPLDLIFTKSRLLLSKTSKEWRQWQDEYDDCMASLSFESEVELLDYIQMDYKLSDIAIKGLTSEITGNESEIIELRLPDIDM